jgi:SAM-dependent methyltransferase
MRHEEHVALIRDGVAGAGPRWLELGAGDGEFTLALADVVGPGARLTTLDLDADAVARGAARVAERFPAVHLSVVVADLTHGLPGGPFDGVLAANSLHYVRDLRPTLAAIHEALVPGGRLVVVEYDSDRGNPWVPHPFSFARWTSIAPAAGFEVPRLLHRVPSRFLGAIYAAVTTRP